MTRESRVKIYPGGARERDLAGLRARTASTPRPRRGTRRGVQGAMCKLSQVSTGDSLVALRKVAPGRADLGVELDDAIRALLAANAPVAVGVSGGKDSCAAAIAVFAHLDAVGHTGPRLLVHADLGDKNPALDIEWADSLPACERLAALLGVELLVVKRPAGGMVKRWQTRWKRNLERYAQLRCVRLILPWSTPSMRFCTSELKSAPIAAALKRRWPGQAIVSACGIRREEGNGKDSNPRTNAETSQINNRLTGKKNGTSGVDWNPIAAYTTADVFALCASRNFQMHEGYALGMKRISCRVCIMQDQADQRISAAVEAHGPVIGTLVNLEIASTFGFQGSHWLADNALERLTPAQRIDVELAKARAEKRRAIEQTIPKHLLYTKGWPTVMPTAEEAEMLCGVRREVAELLGIEVRYTEPAAVIARYADLMAQNAAKVGAKAQKAASKKKKAQKAASKKGSAS